MKKYIGAMAGILAILFAASSVWAAAGQDRKTLGVLPFTIHSAEDLGYMRSGIWDMLISRLSASGEFAVADKQVVAGALEAAGKTELVAADAYDIGNSLGLDYVVWGSITKIGNSISLDGKLMDVRAETTPVSVFEQTRGMDDIIPKIGEFARKISAHARGEEFAAAAPAPVTPPTVSPPSDPGRTVRTGEPVDALRSERGTMTSIINPAFILSPDVLEREGFFMSQRYPRLFKGMDIGDVDGDGKNDVVVIDRNNIFVYQLQEAGLVLKSTIPGRSYDNFVAVDVADINGSGRPEIIVTNMRRTILHSFVVEYRDEEYETIASQLRWFLRVVDSPDGPRLLGQEVGMSGPFDNPIYEIVWDGGTYRQGERMSIPQGLSVYGLTLASLDGGRTERVIALDNYDRLNVYQRTTRPLHRIHAIRGGDELLWRSPDSFGGSANRIDFEGSRSGVDDTRSYDGDNVYANVRILAHDLKGDGKNEIIVVKNLSPAGRILHNVRVFTRSEIYGFQWDGLGMIENWKTRTIQGAVTDYQLKDMNNDGRTQLVMALVLPSRQSVIVAYDINL